MGDHEKKAAVAGEEAYELNLDESSTDSVEEAMRSALDAVEKLRDEREEAEDESAAEVEIVAAEPEDPADAASSEEAAQLKERLMRTLADFDNFRKRTEREKESLRRFAVADVMKDVLGVVDNLERAMASSGSIEELKQGLEMILRQQSEVMKRFGVQRVEAEGQPFDPTVHEAVAREDSSDIDVPTVLRELQSGYTIHDRLLRPAMVHVAMPRKAPPAAAAPAAAGAAAAAASEDGANE
ncbi:MAG: nucleotide exchange factor GrpE [Acidobacteriota bacterium]